MTDDLDFITLSTDGIFDKLTDEELVLSAWDSIRSQMKTNENVTNQNCCESGIDAIMSRALMKKTQDNISTVMISFRNFV